MGLTRIRAEQISDIDYKQAVRVISTANVTLVGGAPSQIDSVNLSANNRVLVAGQTTASQNGLYDVTVVGAGSDGTWVRTSDSNATGEINAGMIVMVTEGSVYADTQWKLITDDPIVVGTTALTFTINILSTVGGANTQVQYNNSGALGGSAAFTFNQASNAVVVSGNVTGGNVLTGGLVSATGNVTGNYFIGNGSQLTGLPATYSNSNVQSYLASNANVVITTTGNITTTANISGAYILGNGSQLTGLPATYDNSNVVNLLNTGLSGNIIPSANVTYSLGNVTNQWASVYVGANTLYINNVAVSVNADNILTVAGADVVTQNANGNINGGNVSVTGNITGNYFIGNGSALSSIAGANVSGQVGNALISGTVYTNAQPNITSTGTLTSVTATGLISTTGNVSGNYIIGNGALLTDITAGNITGAYSNTNVSSFLAAFGSNTISTTGTVTSGNITGSNIQTAGSISATGNVTGNYILGNGALLTGVITSVANINNGTSNVTVTTSGGNITVGIGGTNNVAVFATTGEYITGVVSATGNVTGAYIIGNGSQLTGLPAGYANSNAASYFASGTVSTNILTTALISATGNVTGNYIIGNGSALTSLTGANVTGTVANATSAVTAGTVTTNAQPNITSVGTLTSVTVTGNTSSGNLLTGGLVSATGNVTGGNIVTAGLITATGNVTAGNILTGGLISATSTITSAANITGGNVLTGGVVSATANVTGGNVLTAGLISSTGNITTAATVNANSLVGTNIVVASTGSLSLNPTANIDVNNRWIINLQNPVSAQDAATKNYVDAALSNVHYHNPANAATTTTLAATFTGATIVYNNGASGVGANLVMTGNTYTTIDGVNIAVANSRILVKNEANATWNGIYTYSNSTVITRTNTEDTAAEWAGGDTFFVSAGTVNGNTQWVQTNTVVTIGTSNISFVQIGAATTYSAGSGLSLTGTQFSACVDGVTTTVNGSNQIAVKASANLTTPNIGAATGTSLSVTGTINTGTTILATGNITGGNVLTGGLISATSTITSAANIAGANILTGGLISAAGNATAGNILTAGLISATSTVTAGQFSGNGNTISNIQGANVSGNVTSAVTAGTVTTNAQPNITSVGTLTSITSSGLVSTTGNVQGANVFATANICATGNVSGGNLTTTGIITGNTTISLAGNAVAIGYGSGNPTANNYGVAIGTNTGVSQGTYAVAVGTQAGQSGQGLQATAFGYSAGTTNQGQYAVAVGAAAGSSGQGNLAVAVGDRAGQTSQGNNAVALGSYAGFTGQGNNAIAIGANAGYTNQGNNSIILNATGANLDQTTANTFTVAPVRNDVANTSQVLFYNTTSNEVTYGNTISIAGNILTAGLISATGNITGSNILTGGLISAAGNVTGGNILTANNISAGGTVNAASHTGTVVSVTGLVTAGQFSGNGNTISNIQGTNVSGNVTSAVTSGTVTTNAQPNITSVGTLTSITSSGLVSTTGNLVGANILTAGLISATANITGNYFIGNGSQLTGIATGTPTAIVNGTSNVNVVTSGGNVTVGVGGTANVAVFATTGEYVSGVISATGNIASNANVTAGGSLTTAASLTGIGLTAGNSGGTPIATFLYNNTTQGWLSNVSIAPAANTTLNLGTTGNWWNNFYAVGVNSSTVAATGNISGGNVTTVGVVTATGNITGSNVLTTGLMSSTGNAIHGNILTAGLISATSTITSAANITGGNLLTVGLMSSTGNAIHGNILTAGLVSATSTITSAANISGGNILTVGLMSSTGNAIHGNILTAGLITATGNITGANINTAGLVSATGNVYGNYFVAAGSGGTISGSGNITGGNLLTGGLISATSTITSAANIIGGNITTVGLVTATGNVTGGNVLTAGSISATGNVTGNYILGNGALLTGVITSVANINNGTSNVTVTTSGGNITVGIGGTNNVAVFATTGEYVTGVVSATGNIITAGNIILASTGQQIYISTGTLNVTGTSIVRLSNTSGTNTVVLDSIFGTVSALGNVIGNYFIGNGSQLTGIIASAGAAITNGNSNVTVNANANVTVGVTGTSNVVVVAPTGEYVTGVVSATGNVTGNYFIGNGSQLTGIIASAGAAITNGNSNVTVNANANVTVGVTGTSNVVVVATTGQYVTGEISATGNATAGNIATAGRITATATTPPTADIVTITNAGQPTITAGTSSLQITYVGGAAAVEASAQRIDITPGNTSGGTWNAFRVVPSAGANTGVIQNGMKFDNVVANAGTDNCVNVGTGWDNIIIANGVAIINGTGVVQSAAISGSYTGITAVGTLTTLSVTGNTDSGNLRTAGLVTATGNVTGGNILTANNISAGGNITVSTGTGGNISGANVISANIFTASANITAAAHYGPLANTTSNVYINAAAGNIAMTVGGVANVAVFSNTAAFLTLSTGNTTVAPLVLGNSTTRLTTQTIGAMEFANSSLFFTPFAANRAVVSTPFFYRTGATANTTNVATGQSWLGVGVQLNANTTYNFTGLFNITTSNVNSHVEQIGFGGTATLGNIYYTAVRLPSQISVNANVFTQYFSANTLANMTPAITTAQNSIYQLSGTVSTIAAGSFTPQWATNVAISTTGQFLAGATFRIEPISQGNTTVSVGVWA